MATSWAPSAMRSGHVQAPPYPRGDGRRVPTGGEHNRGVLCSLRGDRPGYAGPHGRFQAARGGGVPAGKARSRGVGNPSGPGYPYYCRSPGPTSCPIHPTSEKECFLGSSGAFFVLWSTYCPGAHTSSSYRSRLSSLYNLRGCYELARQWLANGENGRPTVNRANRAIRILMRFFSQVHNTLLVFDATAERVCKRLNIAPGGSTRRLLILRGNPPP